MGSAVGSLSPSFPSGHLPGLQALPRGASSLHLDQWTRVRGLAVRAVGMGQLEVYELHARPRLLLMRPGAVRRRTGSWQLCSNAQEVGLTERVRERCRVVKS